LKKIIIQEGILAKKTKYFIAAEKIWPCPAVFVIICLYIMHMARRFIFSKIRKEANPVKERGLL